MSAAGSRWATALLLLGGGCASTGGDASSAPRIAFGAGQVTSLATIEPSDSNPAAPLHDLDDARTASGFLEMMFDGGQPAVAMRVVAAQSAHQVETLGEDARLSQVMGFGLVSTSLVETDWIRLSVGGGLGLGAAEIDYLGALAPPGVSGLEGALAGVIEAEFAHHALLGVMGWAGVIGEPGDTRAEVSSVMVYGGWRF